MKYPPFGTFSDFPAIFGNSQDESKFLILEWRRTYWWLLKNPPPPPLPSKPSNDRFARRRIWWGRKWGADEFWIKTSRSRSDASAKPLFRRHISIALILQNSSLFLLQIVSKLF